MIEYNTALQKEAFLPKQDTGNFQHNCARKHDF